MVGINTNIEFYTLYYYNYLLNQITDTRLFHVQTNKFNTMFFFYNDFAHRWEKVLTAIKCNITKFNCMYFNLLIGGNNGKK